MNPLKSKTISGLMWRFLERCGAQTVSFVVSIVLARLLDPNVYGLVAMVTVITSILQVFVDSGLGNALIQKKDADDLDFSSVFYFNIVFSIALYIILFMISPQIANFYEEPELTPVIRVLGISLLISAVKNVQQAYVSKSLQFKRFFYATLGGTIGAAVIGISMAYLGYGVWALVVQTLFNMTVDTVILWITVKWRPKVCFSFSRLKRLIGYGWKLLASGLLHTIYTDLRTLIIGKMYNSQELAYYNRGKSFPAMIVQNITSSIDSVLLPTMSGVQENKSVVKAITRRSIMISSYFFWPMMIGMAVVAKPLVILLLTDKWLPAVPFLQIACLSLAIEPLQTANLNAIKSIGRSDIFLRLEFVKKITAILILLVAMRFGVLAIALSGFLYALLASALNSSPNKKLLDYSYLEQLSDIAPPVLASAIMGGIVYLVSLINLPIIISLILQVIIGVAVYVLLSAVFKMEAYTYVLTSIKQLKRGE